MSPSARTSTTTGRSRIASGSLAAVALHVVVLLAVSYLLLSRKSGALFNDIDGANMLIMVGRQFEFTSPAFGFSANPLQGMSDIWFGFNAWFSPGYLIPHWLWPGLTVADSAYHVAVYVTHVAILFVAILVFARTASLRLPEALIGAWATVLLVFPFFGLPLIFPILQLQPNLSLSIAQTLLIVSAFSALGRTGRSALEGYLKDGLLALVMLALSMHLLLLSPTVIMLCLVFMVFAGAGFLFASLSRYEVMVKCAAVVLVAGILVASGFATYLLGMFEFTAAKIFGSTFANDRMSFYFVSILFQNQYLGPAGPILAVAGLAGLLHASVRAERRIAILARAILTLMVASLTLGFVTVYVDFWRGPSPVYLEAMLWPLYALFAARLLVVIVCYGVGLVRAGRALSRSSGALSAALLAVVPVLLLFLSTTVVTPQTVRPYTFPPTKPSMIDYLQQKIGVTSDNAPLGRVAVFDLGGLSQPMDWLTLYVHSYERMRRVGNDFRVTGLWYFGIPTLFEYSPALSPALYRAVTTLLARPDDIQWRSVFVLRKPNPSALATLGIRYAMSDTKLEMPLVMTEDTGNDETLYLYEVPGAIEGAASPTNIETVDSFDAAVSTLGQPDFDPHTTAVAISTDVTDQDISELVPATDVQVNIVREKYRVTATSPGRSLLVIPVEFSRCLIWESAGDGGSTPRLLRINALETGIVFDRRIDGKFYYFTGPFTNARCRIADAREFSNMLAQ